MCEKTVCGKDFIKEFERDVYMKIIVTIILTNLVTNPLLYLFYSVKKKTDKKKQKTKIKFSAIWWAGNEKLFFFLFIASGVLLQRCAKINRVL